MDIDSRLGHTFASAVDYDDTVTVTRADRILARMDDVPVDAQELLGRFNIRVTENPRTGERTARTQDIVNALDYAARRMSNPTPNPVRSGNGRVDLDGGWLEAGKDTRSIYADDGTRVGIAFHIGTGPYGWATQDPDEMTAPEVGGHLTYGTTAAEAAQNLLRSTGHAQTVTLDPWLRPIH